MRRRAVPIPAALALALALGACASAPPGRSGDEARGIALERAGHLRRAMVALRAAAEGAPGDPGPRAALAQAYADQGWQASATQEWERAWSLCGGAAGAEAQACSRTAIALEGIYLARGGASFKASLWAGAAADFRRAAALDPGSTRAWLGLAQAADALGDRASAEAAYGRCFALMPGDAGVAWGYAQAAVGMGRLQEGLGALRRYNALKPGDAVGLNDQAAVEVELGRDADSLPLYDRALALKPGLTAALNGKASALYYLGRFSEARALWARVLDLAPDDPTATRDIRTLVRMGR